MLKREFLLVDLVKRDICDSFMKTQNYDTVINWIKKHQLEAKQALKAGCSLTIFTLSSYCVEQSGTVQSIMEALQALHLPQVHTRTKSNFLKS